MQPPMLTNVSVNNAVDMKVRVEAASAPVSASMMQESGKGIDSKGRSRDLVSLLMNSDSETDYPDEETLQRCLDSLRGCVTSEGTEGKEMNSLVNRCAEAVADDDFLRAESLISALREKVSPSGSVAQRLAHCFTEALAARITGNKVRPPPHFPIQTFYKTYRLAAEVLPVVGVAVFFTNQTILNHTRTAKRIHVVDYGISHAFNWFCLMKDLSLRPGGPPELRLTGVDFPNHHMSVPVHHTGEKLAAYAKLCGLPFQFHLVVSTDWDLVSPSELRVRDACNEKDEALIVTGIYRLRQTRDEPCVDETPRKRLVRQIASMKPVVFIQAELPVSCNFENLEMRVREGLEFYSGVFGAIEEIVPEEREVERRFMEWIHAMDVMNMVASEGEERRERPECYKLWQIAVQQAGFRPVKLQQNVYCKAVEMVRSYKGNFSVDRSGNWLLINWKHHLLSAITAWSPKHEAKV